MPSLRDAVAALRAPAWGVLVLAVVVSWVMLLPLAAGGRLASATHLGWALVLTLGAAGAWAVLLVVPAAIVGALLHRTSAARAIGFAGGLAIAELGLAVAAIHFAEHHVRAAALGRAAVGLVLGVAIAIVVARRWRAPSSAIVRGARALPLVVPLAILLALPDHVRAHAAATSSLLAASLLPYAILVPRARASAPAHALALGGTLALALAFGRHPGLAAALHDGHAPTRWIVDAGRALTDFDRDGSSAWFGGRDCASFDALRGPGQDEVAGNRVDDNCLLGDLADDRERTIPAIAAARADERTSLLVISVDALRPDRMSIYGYARATTPRIAEHFADAIRFERAYAESASTRDTLPSLLTGRTLAELPWHRNRAVVLDPRTRTLAHELGARGWQTIAVLPFVSLNMMGATDLGFVTTEIYDDKPADTARDVNRRLLAGLRGHTGPFFAFVHYYEPHEPYRRHRGYADVSSDAYDQEVAAVDAAIGELLDALAADGRLDRTAIVLTSDHGEAFGEHGHRFHNEGVYEEDLRVPWLLRLPSRGGRAVSAAVSTTAMVATLCDALGWPLPERMPPTVASVLPLVDGTQEQGAAILATGRAGLDRERMALVDGELKILFDRELAAFEVFDLAEDPGELHDLGSVAPALVDARVDAAAWTLEHVIGAAASRRRRAASRWDLSPSALTPPAGAPPEIADAWAELSHAIDGSGLPPRVLVHAIVRSDFRGDLDVVLREGDDVVQRVTGPVENVVGDAPFVEDVRTFKVYVEDVAQIVELRIEPSRWTLGAIETLPVGGD